MIKVLLFQRNWFDLVRIRTCVRPLDGLNKLELTVRRRVALAHAGLTLEVVGHPERVLARRLVERSPAAALLRHHGLH